MHRPLLVRGARQLLTLRGPDGPRRGASCLDLGVIHDGSVLIRDGRIVSVGPSRRLDNLAEARGAVVYEAHGAVVMPGFVDAQSEFPENAGVLRRFLELAFSHGSTAVGGRASYSVLRNLPSGVLAQVKLVPYLDVGPDFDESQVSRAVRRGLAKILRVDLSAQPRAALHLFRSLGAAMRSHSVTKSNPDWLGLALAYGVSTVEIDSPLDQAQLSLLADSPACAVVTSTAAEIARKLVDRSAAVALGSGFGAAAGATCSMLAAAVFVTRKGGLDLAEAITLSTINAAFALDIAGECGSLEPGKQADLLVLHVSDYRDIANFAGVNVVSKVFRAGTLVT